VSAPRKTTWSESTEHRKAARAVLVKINYKNTRSVHKNEQMQKGEKKASDSFFIENID